MDMVFKIHCFRRGVSKFFHLESGEFVWYSKFIVLDGGGGGVKIHLESGEFVWFSKFIVLDGGYSLF